jgi:lactoylglutathione lyase
MGVSGFFHAGVTVRDMDAALRFYRDALGLELKSLDETSSELAWEIWDLRAERVKIAFLRIPGSDALIELFEFAGVERHSASARPCDYGAGHFCLYVDDAEAALERIRAHGFGARSGVVDLGGESGRGPRAVYAIDPDGYHVELFERRRHD